MDFVNSGGYETPLPILDPGLFCASLLVSGIVRDVNSLLTASIVSRDSTAFEISVEELS